MAAMAHCVLLVRVVTKVESTFAQADYDRARDLVMRFGWNATAYQILNPGMQLWFAPGNGGVIGFVRQHRTRVVAGAPVCDLDSLEAIATEFVLGAAKGRERVCFFGAGERLDALAVRFGWSRVLL